MRIVIFLIGLAMLVGCGNSSEVARLKAEAELARAEVERVKAEAEADRLKAELERLKSVEEATQKVAAQTQDDATKEAEPSIVGKWQMRNLPNTLEFFEDGIMRETGSAKSTDSRYRLLSHNRMETESPGLLSGTNRFEWSYQLSFDGQTLTMTPNSLISVSMTLDRIK